MVYTKELMDKLLTRRLLSVSGLKKKTIQDGVEMLEKIK